jgi:predicted regulator of Ras-like GTPase activity (Roadblock/LC7/MglB family)
MQLVLEKINALPNVVGSMVCNEEGRLLASLFPPVFDQQDIEKASGTLADTAFGLQEALGGVKSFDFRYGELRVFVRALPKSFLLMLCSKAVNMQLLSISLNVVYKKLEKLVETASMSAAVQPLAATPQTLQPLAPQPVPSQAASIVIAANGTLLMSTELLKSTANTYWEQMLASVAVNKLTAKQISDHYKHGAFKKLKLTCPETGLVKIFAVNVINDDPNHLYDNKIIINKAAQESVRAVPGKQLQVELAVGSGFLGWEGI